MPSEKRTWIRLPGNFKEITSPNSRDILYIDNLSGYWFGVPRIYQPFIQLLQQGTPPDALDYSIPGWKDIFNRLERDGQFDQPACPACQELTAPPRIGLIIIEPCQYCNLHCRYCFESTPARGQKMTRETADQIVEKLLTVNLAEHIVVEFSGGEPFLNFPIFRYLVDRIASAHFPPGCASNVTFTAQSNGTVMTAEIAAFLRSSDMTIGISLDGPADLHNKNRVFANGRGSWDTIMRNLDILRRQGVGYGFLSVIDRPEDVEASYDFLANQDPMTIRINLRRVNGRSKAPIPDEALTQIADADYAIFRRSLTACMSDLPAPRLANMCHMIENIVMPAPVFMCQRTPCGAGINQLVFDYAGNCWPCQEFVGNQRFQIATSHTDDIPAAVARHPLLSAMRNRRLGDSEACRNCPWNHFCQGGCFATTYYAAEGCFTESLRTQTPHCAYYKRIFGQLIWDVYYEHAALLEYAFGEKGLHPHTTKQTQT